MRIEISLDTEDRADLTALSALIISLRGDTPEDFGSPDARPVTVAPSPPAPPVLAETIASNTRPASESLIEAEAARVADTPPPPPGAAPDVDKTGLPYDERIHSSTKAVNQDGSWRNKRGVDAALLASVTAELRAQIAAPAEPEPQSPEAAFSPPADATTPPTPPPADTPPAPPAPPADTPPPPPAGDGSITYPAIIKAANDKGMTYDQLNQTAITLGLAAFKDLVKRPDLFESFMASIG